MDTTTNTIDAHSTVDGAPCDAFGDGLLITVRGHPRPQPRPRFVNGRTIGTTDKKALCWRAAILRSARASVRLRDCSGMGADHGLADNHKAVTDHGPVNDPMSGSHGVSVDVVFRFATKDTARHGLPHTGKPDGDNLAKLVLDVLVEAKALGGDDARCASLSVRKLWDRSNPGMTVLVRPIVPLLLASDPMPADRIRPSWLSGKPLAK